MASHDALFYDLGMILTVIKKLERSKWFSRTLASLFVGFIFVAVFIAPILTGQRYQIITGLAYVLVSLSIGVGMLAGSALADQGRKHNWVVDDELHARLQNAVSLFFGIFVPGIVSLLLSLIQGIDFEVPSVIAIFGAATFAAVIGYIVPPELPRDKED